MIRFGAHKVLWYRRIVPAVFVAWLLVTGCTSLFTDEKRFGWGMFSYRIVYAVRYWWEDESGTPIHQTPDVNLRGTPAALFGFDKINVYWYGLSSLRSLMHAYAKESYAAGPPEGARVFRIDLYYRKNEEPDLVIEPFSYPPLS